MRLVNKPPHIKGDITTKIKRIFVENGYKLIKFHQLLGFNGESLPQNDILVIYWRLWRGTYESMGDTTVVYTI